MKYYKLKKDADIISTEKEWSFIVCDECNIDIRNKSRPQYDSLLYFEVEEVDSKNRDFCSGECFGKYCENKNYDVMFLKVTKKGVNHEN